MRALFTQWQSSAQVATNDDISERAQAAAYELQMAAEEAIVGATPRTVAEYAMKIIVVDDHGEMAGSINQRQLVAEAYTIAGVEGWTAKDETELREWREAVEAGEQLRA